MLILYVPLITKTTAENQTEKSSTTFRKKSKMLISTDLFTLLSAQVHRIEDIKMCLNYIKLHSITKRKKNEQVIIFEQMKAI